MQPFTASVYYIKREGWGMLWELFILSQLDTDSVAGNTESLNKPNTVNK